MVRLMIRDIGGDRLIFEETLERHLLEVGVNFMEERFSIVLGVH